MLRSSKTATPDTAGTLVVPPRCAPSKLGSLPMAMVTLSAKPLAMLPNASNAVTRTGGEIRPRIIVLLGCPVNASAVAGPGSTTTVGVCASGTAVQRGRDRLHLCSGRAERSRDAAARVRGGGALREGIVRPARVQLDRHAG